MIGYSLTDDPAEPRKYVFTETTELAGGQYLVVFAGDDDDPTTGSDLYTGFGLSSGGEYLGFFDDGVGDGNLVSEFGPSGTDYPAQFSDVSYGLVANDSFDTSSFFATPTPGSSNIDPVDGVIDTLPTVSVKRGFHDEAFTTNIASQSPGAILVYTTDGTQPSLNNGIQVQPTNSTAMAQTDLFVNSTTVLRTASFKQDFISQGFTTHSYVFLNDVIGSDVLDSNVTDQYSNQELKDALLDIPTLSFNFDNDIVNSQTPEQRASIEWLAPDGSEGFQLDAGIAAFGGNATTFVKKSFRLNFRGQYGFSELEFPLFEGFDDGVTPATETFDQLEFRSGSHDRSMRGFGLSNRFVDETLLDAGHNVPHGRFVHIYINGEYWGQYHMRERWNDDFLASYNGGDSEDYDAINGNANAGPRGWSPGEVFDGSGVGWDNINAIVANNNLSASQRFEALRETVNLEEYIDFLLVWMSGQSESEYRAGGASDGSVPFTFYLNDADGWLRDPVDGSGGQGGDKTGNIGPANILGRLVSEADPDFMAFYADRIQNMFLNDGPLSVTQSTARLQELIDQVELSVILESARWGSGSVGEALSVDQFQERSQDALDRVLPNIIERDNNVIERLRDRGVFPDLDAPEVLIDGVVQNGGPVTAGSEVTFSSLDTVYFTVDGSDPRSPGGDINDNAIAFNPGSSVVTTPVFGTGSLWRYNDTGTDLGTAWRAASFNDTGAGWSEDPGDFGFGDGQLTPVADNDQITTYFRRTFNFIPGDFDTATFSFKRDDGAVVYLNGQEIFRDNLPTGTILFSTTANDAIANAAENTFHDVVFDPSLLQAGSNTFAVEIHQQSATSSDITFDAELSLSQQLPGSIPTRLFSTAPPTSSRVPLVVENFLL